MQTRNENSGAEAQLVDQILIHTNELQSKFRKSGVIIEQLIDLTDALLKRLTLLSSEAREGLFQIETAPANLERLNQGSYFGNFVDVLIRYDIMLRQLSPSEEPEWQKYYDIQFRLTQIMFERSPDTLMRPIQRRLGCQLHHIALYMNLQTHLSIEEQKYFHQHLIEKLSADSFENLNMGELCYYMQQLTEMFGAYYKWASRVDDYTLINRFLCECPAEATQEYAFLTIDHNMRPQIDYEILVSRLIFIASQYDAFYWNDDNINFDTVYVNGMEDELNQLIYALDMLSESQRKALFNHSLDKDYKPNSAYDALYGVDVEQVIHEAEMPLGFIDCEGRSAFWLLCVLTKRIDDVIDFITEDPKRLQYQRFVKQLCNIIFSIEFDITLLNDTPVGWDSHDRFVLAPAIWFLTALAARQRAVGGICIDIRAQLNAKLTQNMISKLTFNSTNYNNVHDLQEKPEATVLTNIIQCHYDALSRKQQSPLLLDRVLAEIGDDIMQHHALYKSENKNELYEQGQGFCLIVHAMRLALLGDPALFDCLTAAYPNGFPEIDYEIIEYEEYDLIKSCLYYAYLMSKKAEYKGIMSRFIHLFRKENLHTVFVPIHDRHRPFNIESAMVYYDDAHNLIPFDEAIYEQALAKFLTTLVQLRPEVKLKDFKKADGHELTRSEERTIQYALSQRASTRLLTRFRLFIPFVPSSQSSSTLEGKPKRVRIE